MLKFIAELFATPTSRTAAPKVRLALERMEDRAVPTGFLSPDATRGFNPWPEPPGIALVSRMDTHGIIIVDTKVGVAGVRMAVEPTDFVAIPGTTAPAPWVAGVKIAPVTNVSTITGTTPLTGRGIVILGG